MTPRTRVLNECWLGFMPELRHSDLESPEHRMMGGQTNCFFLIMGALVHDLESVTGGETLFCSCLTTKYKVLWIHTNLKMEAENLAEYSHSGATNDWFNCYKHCYVVLVFSSLGNLRAYSIYFQNLKKKLCMMGVNGKRERKRGNKIRSPGQILNFDKFYLISK